MPTKRIISLPRLKDYAQVVGPSTINELTIIASYLKDTKIQHISLSSSSAETTQILRCTTSLFKELNIDIEWDIIDTDPNFFNIARKFSNAILGRYEIIVDNDFDIYLNGARGYIANTRIKGDAVFVHDIAPLAIIQNKKKFKKRWVWVCSLDASSPNERVWDFISTFVEGYDACIYYSPKFVHPVKIPQFLICPAIDPLSDKNKPLSREETDSVINRYGIDKDKPIILQISACTYLKELLDIVEAFKLVKRYVNAQLVLGCTIAQEDFEASRVFEELKEKTENIKDISILRIQPEYNDIDINALQRSASVVTQLSVSEGFALNITEALWKAKPVVAKQAGSIPLQIKHRYSGLLCHSIEGAALQIRQFLNNPDYARRLSENARVHIERNFLITRLVREYMLINLALVNQGDIISL